MSRSSPLSTVTLAIGFLFLSIAPVSIAGEQARGVGSRGAAVGPIAPSTRTGGAAPTTGPKLGDAPLATVTLLDNDLNRCMDGTDDCRVYLLEQTAADPQIAYAGDAIVQHATELKVFMERENSPSLLTCILGSRPVQWVDFVEHGRTIANLEASNLDRVYQLAHEPDRLSVRYRLVWCPIAGGGQPFGQSWRLRVEPKSTDPLKPPGLQ